MKTSVIIPLYNAEKYLSKLVDSLSKVDATDIEFIFVNDGSTDGTKELCESAKEKLANLTVIHKQNGGVSSARNVGLDAATGEYICFADCDDEPKPNMYSALSSAADNGCDMVLGGYEKVDASGNADEVKLPYCGKVSAKTVAYSMAFWSGLVDGESIRMLYGSVWPNLYKKSIIDEYDLRFPEGVVLGEDLLFNLEYLSHCDNVYMLGDSLYRYFVGNESATRKRVPDLWNRYKLLLRRTNELLVKAYGESEELSINLARQYINDAISFIEEQIIPYNLDNAKEKIKSLCRELNEMSVPKTMFANGTTKEKIEAALFRFGMIRLIYRWLK